MKNIIIFGNKDFARMIYYYLKKDKRNYNIVAFTVHKKYIETDKYCGLPVIPFEQIEKNYPHEKNEIIIAIGYNNMNKNRKKIFEECKKKGYILPNYIHASSEINDACIGEGNIILEKCLFHPFVKIGNGNLFWDNVIVSHDGEIGNYNTFCGSSSTCGYVKVNNNCFFGKGSIIKEYLEISNYSLIGANTFVNKDTNSYSVIVNPKSIELKNIKSIDLL